MTDLYPSYREGKLDAQVKDFLTELAKAESVPLRLKSLTEVRNESNIMPWVREGRKAFQVENLTIAGKTGPIPVRLYIPSGAGPFPVLVYFHGGGWVFGSLDEADPICNRFAVETPAVVVSVDYSLSPEKKYPVALEEAYSTVEWVAKEIPGYQGDPRRIGVAGESAGANLATIAAMLIRDRNGPPIAYQLLLCPVTDLSSFATDSYRLFGDGVWLSKANMEYYASQYLRDRQQASEPYASPLLAKDLSNLPPAHIITAEFDVLRDEGEAYARRLAASGNTVTHKRYGGVIHSFFVLNKVFAVAEAALDDCVSQLRTL